jgi:hypothetical protein
MYGEESNTGGIHTCYNEICPDVSLVPEEVLLEHGHASHDSGFAASGEGVKLEFGGDESSCEFGVCGGTGSSTPYLRGDVVKLLAVLGRSKSASKVRGWWFIECTLSATMGPLVALVSAAI